MSPLICKWTELVILILLIGWTRLHLLKHTHSFTKLFWSWKSMHRNHIVATMQSIKRSHNWMYPMAYCSPGTGSCSSALSKRMLQELKSKILLLESLKSITAIFNSSHFGLSKNCFCPLHLLNLYEYWTYVWGSQFQGNRWKANYFTTKNDHYLKSHC